MDEELTLEQLRAGDTPQRPVIEHQNEVRWWQEDAVKA